MAKKEARIQLHTCMKLWYTERTGMVHRTATIITTALFLGLLAVSLIPLEITAADNEVKLASTGGPVSSEQEAAKLPLDAAKPAPERHWKHANFEKEIKSNDAQLVADWVADSGDNQGLPFAIVDKVDAKVFVFYPDGRLRGTAPCLLGLAKGDDSAPGIGNKKLSAIRPEDRTTPAGRFVASIGYNAHGRDVLWVSYDLAVSMHRVVSTKPSERRLERLATPTPLDNRISFGCINVPVKFFNDVISPTFTGTRGIVYVLPEVKTKKEIFAKYYEVE